MIRKVFIVGAPLSYETPTFYNGVKRDVNNYYNFFTSATGGAYFDFEVIYLENPSWATLKKVLNENYANHITFVFSGHGATGLTSQSTYLNINSYERVTLIDIVRNIRASKQLIITDSCRSYIRENYSAFIGDLETPKKYMQFPSYLEFNRARRIFDNAIMEASNGVQVLYSCSSGEKSLLTSEGSYYSKSLLTSIKNWSLKIEEKSVLLGLGAYRFSKQAIKRYNRNQNPKTYQTQDEANFPFALRLGTELL